MASVVACPSQEVTDLVRSLGLDPSKVVALNLRVRPGHLVTVTVQQVVCPGELAKAVQRFVLVPSDPRP